jgi:hypothetical protein
VSFVDITTTAATPGSQRAAVSSATTTTICAAPGASTTRQIKRITLRNTGTASNTLTVQTDVSGTNYTEIQAALAAGEALHYQDGRGWDVLDVAGRVKQQASEAAASAAAAASASGASPSQAVPTQQRGRNKEERTWEDISVHDWLCDQVRPTSEPYPASTGKSAIHLP